MKLKNIFFIVVPMLLAFTACNTVEGFGKDLKSAGNSIENSAKKKEKEEESN